MQLLTLSLSPSLSLLSTGYVFVVICTFFQIGSAIVTFIIRPNFELHHVVAEGAGGTDKPAEQKFTPVATAANV